MLMLSSVKAQLAVVLLVALSLCSCSALVRPGFSTELSKLRTGTYRIDPLHSAVLFKVKHMGFSKYVGRFNRFEASLDFDPAEPENAKLHAIVYTSSIDVNNPDFAATLAGPDWFNSKAFPQAVFKTRSSRRFDAETIIVSGEFTLLGISHPLDLLVSFNGGADNRLTGRYTIGFEASSTLQRSAYGMDAHTALVSDDVELELHAEFQQQ